MTSRYRTTGVTTGTSPRVAVPGGWKVNGRTKMTTMPTLTGGTDTATATGRDRGVRTAGRAWLGKRCAGVRDAVAARAEAGMTTAEYAVGTLAACGFAALLYKVVTSGSVAEALEALVTKALDAKF